jgi:hypothetical protein
VQLVEIDVVRLQPLQRALDAPARIVARGDRRPVTHMPQPLARDASWRGCSRRAAPVLGVPRADDLFGPADGLGATGFTGYISAVSTMSIPAASAMSIWRWASSSGVWLPQVIVPRQ